MKHELEMFRIGRNDRSKRNSITSAINSEIRKLRKRRNIDSIVSRKCDIMRSKELNRCLKSANKY